MPSRVRRGVGWGTRDKSIGEALWWAEQTPIHHDTDCPSEDADEFPRCLIWGAGEMLPPTPTHLTLLVYCDHQATLLCLSELSGEEQDANLGQRFCSRAGG